MIEKTFSSHDNLAWHSRITKLQTQYTIGRVPNLEIGKFDSMKEAEVNLRTEYCARLRLCLYIHRSRQFYQFIVNKREIGKSHQ